MGRIKYFILTVSVVLLSCNVNAITWKIKGSGGIIINPDGSQTVCPNQASAVCAEITGSLWDLLDYLFKASYSTLYTGQSDVL